MTDAPRRIGRYEIGDTIARGGMAQIHLGRQRGDAGFTRTVAIKRLHGEFASEPEFVAMLVDEARLASRVDHPNVVSPSDVVSADGELCIIMPFVAGLSLARLMACASRAGELPSPGVAGRIMSDALLGLHAAHEARSEEGEFLGLVHRDVSPQNVVLGRDGIARVIDFGIAMANARWQTTREGQIKGKLPYMAREQLLEGDVDRRVDVYAAGVMLWELLVGRRLFEAKSDAALFGKVLESNISPPHVARTDLDPQWSTIVMRAVAREQNDRYPTALEFATALEQTLLLPDRSVVGRWVNQVAHAELDTQRDLVRRFERAGAGELPSSPTVSRESSAGLTPVRPVSHASSEADAEPNGSREIATRSRTRLLLIGLGIAFVCLVLVLYAAGGMGLRETGGASDQTSAPTKDFTGSMRSASAPPATPGVQASPAATGPDSKPAVDEPPQSASAPPEVATAKPGPKPAPVSKPRPVSVAKPMDCSKPYTVGADGIRRVRRECLGK